MNNWLVPKILFGAELYSRGGTTIQNKIGKIYNQALRQISGAFRTSPISSLVCESGQLPFNHTFLNRLISAQARLNEKNFPAHPLTNRTNIFFKQITNQELPATEKLTRLNDRPWDTTKPLIDWTMKHTKKDHYNATTAQQTFQQLINDKYNSFNHIYTDGSVQSNKTGCGIFSRTMSSSLKLNNNLSIFSAEALALLIAADKATTANKHNIIFTDSASVLEAIEKGTSKHPYVQSIDEHLSSRNITFCWIPSHMGIAGNEAADRLANEGREKPDIPLTPLPKKDLLRWTQGKVREAWEREWRSHIDSKLRSIKQTTLPWTDASQPRDQRILTRIRIGHTRLTHSHLFKKKSPPTCITCGCKLTVEHLLVECRAHTKARQKFSIPHDLSSALINNPTSELNVIQYLKEIEVYDKI